MSGSMWEMLELFLITRCLKNETQMSGLGSLMKPNHIHGHVVEQRVNIKTRHIPQSELKEHIREETN